MESLKSNPKTQKEFWTKVLTPERLRICTCGLTFVCTGNCPPERWGGPSKKLAMQDRSACFCKECMKQSGFAALYRKLRLKQCYE